MAALDKQATCFLSRLLKRAMGKEIQTQPLTFGEAGWVFQEDGGFLALVCPLQKLSSERCVHPDSS